MGGNSLLILNDSEIQENYFVKDALIDVQKVLFDSFNGNITNPIRTVIEFPEKKASILYMPSAERNKKLSILKAVSIFPENADKGGNTTQGIMVVTDTQNGEFLAIMNASYLTRLRTGALSGLATDSLSRKDANVLTVIGTGGMAFEQVLSVLEVRDIKKILLVNPTEFKAHQFKEKLITFGINDDIKIVIERKVSKAVKQSDIICCSTRSLTPVFNGLDIRPGTHVNGVGSYLPHMREVDFDFIKRANKIVVDDLHGIREEAGEFIHAAKQDDWSYEKIHGELKELQVGEIKKRENDDEITFFKSVGSAYFDLAVAKGVYNKAIELGFGAQVKI